MSDDSHLQQFTYEFSLSEKHLQIHGQIRDLGYKVVRLHSQVI